MCATPPCAPTMCATEWLTFLDFVKIIIMRKFNPVNNEIYHIFNRGTEKRNIFLGKKDYERFIVNLIFFNTQQKPLANLSRYNTESACKKIPNDPLIKIHAFSIMPNHFHLMATQMCNNGIERFMHKIEMGYWVILITSTNFIQETEIYFKEVIKLFM